MAEPTRFTILGGGNGAFAAAADLSLKGHEVRVLEVPELASQTIDPIRDNGGIELINPGVEAIAPSGFARINMITSDPEQALSDADIVLYIVPAFAENRFTELCLPYLREAQLVILFCGNFGGALELASKFAANGQALPAIAETEGLVYGAFKQDAVTVKVGGYKKGLACAAFPATRNDEVFTRLSSYFTGFQQAANVLETGLRNLNPIVHAPVSIVNAGRTDSDKPKWRYYWEGVTEPVGELVRAVDRERLAVVQRFGLSLPDIQAVLKTWYGDQGVAGETLATMLSTNPAYEIAWAPQTLNHRFLTEDIPFGMVPIESLASALDIPTPLTSALITLASQLLGEDYRQTGRHLERLGIDGFGHAKILQLVSRGFDA